MRRFLRDLQGNSRFGTTKKVGKGAEACTLHRKLAKFDAYMMNGLNLSFRSDVYSNLKLYLVLYMLSYVSMQIHVRCYMLQYMSCILAKRNVYVTKQ
jgi:hypothetical protein